MSSTPSGVATLNAEEKRALLEKLLQERNNRAHPLSSAQKRLWFLDRLQPNSATYNVPTVLRLRGSLDTDRLRKALSAVVARHDALRTVFVAVDDAPRAKINAAAEFDLSSIDLTGSRSKEGEAQSLIAREVRKPFDLSRDLMIRALLIRLADDECFLVLVTHHIASDEWSLRLLLRELAELYQAFGEGRQTRLPALPIQYPDFAAWQEEWLQGEACQEQLAYWKQKLQRAPALQLPTDRPRGNEQNFAGALCHAVLPVELATELKRLSRDNHATLFMTLLAAFKVLLFRSAAQEDIVVGCPIAGRNRVETESLIGFFVNTLPIRTEVDGSRSFRQLLSAVRENTLAAYANQDLPFDRVVEEVQPERSSNRMPLVQVVFALNNEYVQDDLFPGVVVEELEIGTGTAKFDLTFVTKDTPRGLSAVIEYNSSLFDESRIRRLLGHFEQLLRSVLANPDAKVADLELITAAEKQFLVHDLNQTFRPYPRDTSVHEIFEEQVARTPGAVALKYGRETITYRELNARANQLAHFLAGEKIGANSLVGVYMERSVDLIVALLGILKAGAAYVPLDLSYPEDRLALMIADARIPLILTDSTLVADLPRHVSTVCLDERRQEIQRQPRQLPLNAATGDSLAYVIYTSGSTGRPKGVAVSHRGITRLVCNTDYVQVTSGDRIAQASNASFDAATFEIWGALLNGACAVGISKETTLSPVEFVDSLREEAISILFLTTALFNQLAREVPGAFTSLKTVMFGGEAVDPKWVQAVLASNPPERLLHVYGPTENTTFSTWHRIREVAEDASTVPASTVPIGKPIANSELYILDAALQPVPIGIVGEIYVGGDGLAHGYLNRPDLTGERFVSHPFQPGARLYKTGDLARFDQAGSVEFIGRVDHQVKLRGFRIELGEIEALLARHPAVSNAVVLLREDVPGDKRLVAYVVAKDGNPSVGELRTFLRGQLPEFMLPSAFVFLHAFPLTPNEKIDRKALPAPEQNRPDLNRSFVAPRDPIEEQLTRIWETVLAVKPIGVADNFFDLGGHSLLAVKLFSRIEKQLGKKLPLATLFRAPTIEQIAAVLREENNAGSWSTIVDIQPKGSRPPFFWIHTLGGDGGGGFFYYRKLAELLGPDQPSFGIRSPQEPFTRIEDMARFYVSEIRKFQREGPYFLGGFCFGGNVAYEMAQQLTAQGEEIGLLVMLETAPPNVNSKQSWNATAAKYSLENIVENVKDFVNHSPQQKLVLLKNKSKRLKEKLRNRIAPPAEDAARPVELSEVIDLANYPEGYVKYAETHWQALTHYHPAPYPGELVLFRAKKQGLTNFSHTFGWDALVDDRVQVTVVPGTHESMLQEPNVQIVAAKLRNLLSQAQRRDAAPIQRELVAAA